MSDGQNTTQDIGQGADRTTAESPVLPDDPPPEPLLTVAEAARRLGVDPKQVRRYAVKLTGQDRTSADVSPLRVRLSAVEALREGAKSEASSKKDSGQDKSEDTNRTRQDIHGDAVNNGLLPATLYQKIIADKNAEIEYLRGQLDLAQKNLAREQTLRALPAPQSPTLEASSGRAGDATRDETGLSGVQASPKPNEGHSEASSAGTTRDTSSGDQESEIAGVTVNGNKKRVWWKLWD